MSQKHLMPIVLPLSCPLPDACRPSPLSHAHVLLSVEAVRGSSYCRRVYITMQGMQQQLQSSVLMQLHFPPWGLTIEPAAEETELVEAGIAKYEYATIEWVYDVL